MLRPGDTVFYSDTSEGAQDRSSIFRNVVQAFKLRPVFYVGAKKDSLNTNVSYEFRRDMYSSKLVIAHLGPPTQDNNIVFYYLPYALKELKLECLLYAAVGFDQTLLLDDTNWLPFSWVPDMPTFKEMLTRDLAQRVERPN